MDSLVDNIYNKLMSEFSNEDPRETDTDKFLIPVSDGTFVSDEDIQLLNAGVDLAGNNAAALANQILLDSLPMAVTSIAKIARFSENDAVKLNAAKYIVERNLGKVEANSTVDVPAWQLVMDAAMEADEIVIPGVTKGMD